MRVVVLADTHIRGSGEAKLTSAAWELLGQAELILHAGDVVGAEFLDELRAIARVHAVLGNNDTELVGVLPEVAELELGGIRVAMIHDSGARRGREGRLHKRFPEAELVVFGHSHIPWDAPGIDGQRLFNPGSATQRRAQPHRTLGLVDIGGGDVRTQLVELA
jgi:putative phosphoesterase